MRAAAPHLYRRGKCGTFYLRRRIPAPLLDTYGPGRREIVRSLHTRDANAAQRALRRALVELDHEFDERAQRLHEQRRAPALQRVTHLAPAQLTDLARLWVHAVLETDEEARRRGLDDEAFASLGARIAAQRAELGPLLARGHVRPILPAMHSFLHLCGIAAKLSPDDEQQAGYAFLEAVVTALGHQAARQAGDAVATAAVAGTPPQLKTWEEILVVWRDYVVERPKATTIAARTAWRQLEAFARQHDVLWPAHVTSQLMTQLVDDMRAKGLSPKTVNERLNKVRAIYRIAVGKHVLNDNPAQATLGVKLPKHLLGQNKRLPFTQEEIRALFASPVFTEHRRSQGQSGEASYWIPLMMYYSGARPEEIAGLTVADVRRAPAVGWYLHITDLTSPEDGGMFAGNIRTRSEPGDANGHDQPQPRRLKNVASRRNIPVAKELIALGFLRYVEFLKAQQATRLFPDLTPDAHGKLSGAFGKFFGRYKRTVGITASSKSLYSLRHTMKDFLEAAEVPSKYLKRLLGHTTGDGAVTDGYGSDLPLEIVARYFRRVRFWPIPARPWEPGRGAVKLTPVGSCAAGARQQRGGRSSLSARPTRALRAPTTSPRKDEAAPDDTALG
ncbi:MAG: integrase [Proteobacteria bacterium]|jgi:integrase|nr:integrase [Pseudomonadota bacterium]